jgi:hypothetical protein
LNLVVVAAAMSFPLPALAAGNCPPGSWFCADAEVNVPGPAPAPRIPAQVAPPPVEEQEAPAPPPVRRFRPPPPPQGYAPAPQGYAPAPQGYAPPPVVIYQPVPNAPPTQVIVVTPGYGYGYGQGYSAPYARPRPPMISAPPVPRWHSEWGMSLRVEGMGINKPGGGTFSAGLGGVGLSLRYRPVPHFAFDMGVDVLAGTDWNGFQRTEVPVSLSGMIFVNPRSRAQFYLLFGGNISRAQVHGDPGAPNGAGNGAYFANGEGHESYTYAGGQAGGGFEFRLSRRVAIDLDVVGFVRKRVDGGNGTPEFTDPTTGQTTDVSGGALGRGGLTFWW